MPTFSMKNMSISRHGMRWSASWTIRASRWQALPVVIARASIPAAASRRASRSVARSPETAPSLYLPANARAVCSSTAVLPAPGEPIRLIARTLASTKCSRRCCARELLSERTCSWISTGTSSESPQPQASLIWNLHLDSFEDDVVTGDQARGAPAHGTGQDLARRDLAVAAGAAPRGGDAGDRALGLGAHAALAKRHERGVQEVDLDAGELADPHVQALDDRPGVRVGFALHAIDERRHDRVLVHHSAPTCATRCARNAARPSAKFGPSAIRASSASSASRWTSSRSMPAAVLSRRFATPTAAVGASASRCASSSARASRSGSATTSVTSPIVWASRAESRVPSSTSSIALRNPTRRGSRNVVLSAPVNPVLLYAHSNVARSVATTRSHAIAMPSPPAAVGPSTAASHGFGARRISEIVEWMYSRICLKILP